MTIQVVIPIWKRPEVTKLCFDYLQSMITMLPQHKFKVLCVISEPEYVEVCDAYGFEVVAFKNDPLGEKINSGIKHALEGHWDYLMTMNSDSVVNPKLFFDYYDELFGKVDFFGVSRVTYVNYYTDEAVDFEYHFSLLGVARCMSRALVERFFAELGCVYEPFRNKGLDDSVLSNSRKLNVKPTFVNYAGQLVYDIKSDVNIHPWEKFADKGVKVENELCCKVG
jgi:hypothetical protein